jgi:hypothetical protein
MLQDVDDYGRDSVDRDERRLADLGRRAVEIFAAAHIASCHMEAAWVEAETIKRQDALIREVRSLGLPPIRTHQHTAPPPCPTCTHVSTCSVFLDCIPLHVMHVHPMAIPFHLPPPTFPG